MKRFTAFLALFFLMAVPQALGDVVDSSGNRFFDNSSNTGTMKFRYRGTLGQNFSLTASTLPGTLTFSGYSTGVLYVASGVLTSEAQLSGTRGGTGVNNSGTFTYGSSNLAFSLSGSTSLTLPSTGTLATLGGSETFTNKTLTTPTINQSILNGPVVGDFSTYTEGATPGTPAAGLLKLYSKSDHKLYTLDPNGTETQVGSGAGTINYITNGDAESNATTGWSVYANASTAPPTGSLSGSLASSNTFTTSASTPLRGNYSFLYTKGNAGSTQGNGVAYPFTIALADQNKPLTIAFDFAGTNTSGSYASGDLAIYILDVTNTTLITPSISAVPTGSGKFLASFQSTSATSYRLYVHQATTTTAQFTFKFDNVVVGPQQTLVGVAANDWQSYVATPTNGGTATYTETAGFWRRVGDSMNIRMQVSIGSGGSGGTAVVFPMPPGYTADTTKFSTSNFLAKVGSAELSLGGAAGTVFEVPVVIDSTNYQGFFVLVQRTTSTAPAKGSDLTANTIVYLEVTVPIANWGANTTLASSRVEYAYSTSAWDSDSAPNDASTTGYGAQGSAITGALTASRTKQVFFQTPLQPSDVVDIEFSFDRINWMKPPSVFNAGGLQVDAHYRQNTLEYGANVQTNGQANSVRANFGQYAAATSGVGYGAAGVAWQNGYYWRVRKSSGVGAGEVTEASTTNNGYVTTGTQSFAGAKQFTGGIAGNTTGVTPAAGMIGEEIKCSSTAQFLVVPTAGTEYDTNVSCTFTPGTWDLHVYNISGYFQTSTTGTPGIYTWLTTSGNTHVQGAFWTPPATVVVSGTEPMASVSFTRRVVISTSTTYKIRMSYSNYNGTPTIGDLEARCQETECYLLGRRVGY